MPSEYKTKNGPRNDGGGTEEKVGWKGNAQAETSGACKEWASVVRYAHRIALIISTHVLFITLFLMHF